MPSYNAHALIPAQLLLCFTLLFLTLASSPAQAAQHAQLSEADIQAIQETYRSSMDVNVLSVMIAGQTPQQLEITAFSLDNDDIPEALVVDSPTPSIPAPPRVFRLYKKTDGTWRCIGTFVGDYLEKLEDDLGTAILQLRSRMGFTPVLQYYGFDGLKYQQIGCFTTNCTEGLCKTVTCPE